jgi:adenylyl-sulfate kinase
VATGFVVWFTGLSGAGKSTLATLLAAEVSARGIPVEVLDGDEMRAHLSKGLGFSREDRDTNVRRIGYVAKLVSHAGACAITAAISPYRSIRDEQRRSIGRFVEVYCRCAIEALADRDPKGLYRKALAGEIPHFTGVTDPYEEPLEPDVVVDTGTTGVDACLHSILQVIEARGYLASEEAARERAPWGGSFSTPRNRVAGTPSFRVEIDARAADVCEGIAFGSLSPLVGPLGEKDATKLAKEGRLESGVAWPLSWTLAVTGDEPIDRGAWVELVESGGARRFVIEASAPWRSAEGTRYVAGEVFIEGEPPIVSLRGRIAEQGGSAAAHAVVRRPLTDGDALLFGIGLELRGKLVMLVASRDPAVRSSVDAFVTNRGLEGSVVVTEIPPLPILDAPRDALLQVAVLRNAGADAAVLQAVDPTLSPRDALRDLRPSEVGLQIVAAGPVERMPDGNFATPRMFRRDRDG